MNEIWKSVVGFCGEYEVSNIGRVKTLKWKKSPHIMRLTISKRGYFRVFLSKNDKKKNYNVHQLVACAFLGMPPVGHEVCHNDGNRLNNNLDNLRYGTRCDNIHDAIKHGTFIGGRGRKNASRFSQLTKEVVVAIFMSEEKPSVLSRRYNVHHTHISKIKQGKNWGHVTASLNSQS